ncbi:MAG: 16S rRNA (cytidine(1402)-2'-O)-methyltransferase [Burkholderiales bacterium]|jgi:16S rRNA (cytidine1402-2'-O)-methyltransferase|nr:16S rRNA (cytidine(1402)-2'-O)-methyltransferase [Burkholderiales bacterium]
MNERDSLLEASGVAAQDLPAGALYVVATPIGNATDITLRALWVLAQVDAIAAEDTRATRPLLARYGIERPLVAAHEHNENEVADRIVARLAAGERIALVTDAGTPAVSDPGARLVRAVRAAGLRVVPIPGASSVLAALAAAGLSGDAFAFLGFPPHAAGARRTWLAAAAARSEAFVLLEAPHRLCATIAQLAEILDPERRVIVARELTKKFETIAETSAAELPTLIAAAEPRGEYVLLIDAAPAAAAPSEIDAATARWLAALAEELPPARAAAVAARATGLPRELLYRALANRPA